MLNLPQRNALTITLRMLEAHLRQAAAWLEQPDSAGILQRSTLRVEPASAATARQVIEVALGEIEALAHEFGLTAVEEDRSATIAAMLSTDWAHLYDVRAGRLVQYGPVDPRLEQMLDPRLERLAQMTLRLAAVMQGGREGPRAQPAVPAEG